MVPFDPHKFTLVLKLAIVDDSLNWAKYIVLYSFIRYKFIAVGIHGSWVSAWLPVTTNMDNQPTPPSFWSLTCSKSIHNKPILFLSFHLSLQRKGAMPCLGLVRVGLWLGGGSWRWLGLWLRLFLLVLWHCKLGCGSVWGEG